MVVLQLRFQGKNIQNNNKYDPFSNIGRPKIEKYKPVSAIIKNYSPDTLNS